MRDRVNLIEGRQAGRHDAFHGYGFGAGVPADPKKFLGEHAESYLVGYAEGYAGELDRQAEIVPEAFQRMEKDSQDARYWDMIGNLNLRDMAECRYQNALRTLLRGVGLVETTL